MMMMMRKQKEGRPTKFFSCRSLIGRVLFVISGSSGGVVVTLEQQKKGIEEARPFKTWAGCDG
jgi:hypothetical protein